MNYLLDIIKAKIVYFALMIVFAKRTLPSDSGDLLHNMLPVYKAEVQWKIENEFQKKFNKMMAKTMHKPTTGGTGGFKQIVSDDKIS